MLQYKMCVMVSAERQVLAFDLLSLALTWAMSRRHQRPLIGTPMVSG
jgi:hypothetical protein